MRTGVLAALLILAACSRQPSYPPKSADEIDQLIAVADAAIDAARKAYAQAPEADLQAATLKVRTALDAAQRQTDEIRDQVVKVDHLAEGRADPMGVAGCISHHLVEIQDIEELSPRSRMMWSMKVGECAANAIVYFNSAPVADSSVVALGLSIIDPIMLVAYARSGLRRGALFHSLDSNKSVIAKFAPECEKNAKPGDTGEVSYRCAAYRVALAVQPKLQALANEMQPGQSP